MKKIVYKHSRGKTEIIIKENLIFRPTTWVFLKRKHVVFIYDQSVLPQAKRVLAQIKKSAGRTSCLSVSAGEKIKDWNSIKKFFFFLQKENTNRDSILVVMGGGSLGDAFGLVAALYQRGISWSIVPTTLLAQVDSSIGGKTGINLSTGKNLLGAFHQPQKILIDPSLLEKLPQREIYSGLGEVIKYAVAQDPALFKFLEKNFNQKNFLPDWAPVLRRCAQLKAQTIQQDEFDQTGVREVLNFGHTFGHALEACTQFKYFKHGEAVTWGMRFAVQLSQAEGKLSSANGEKILLLLRRLPTPLLPKTLEISKLLKLMAKDKKHRGETRFVLLTGPGKALTRQKVNKSQLKITLKKFLANPQTVMF